MATKRERVRAARIGAYALNAKLAKLGTITLKRMKQRAAKVRWDAYRAAKAAQLDRAAS